MNYRHAFHAGNFADVFKHIFLVRILEYLKRKDTPLRFIDTHAGIGSYNLAGDEAQRTGEWQSGIAKLLAVPCPPDIAPLLEPYLDIIRDGLPGIANGAGPGVYPGSPALAQSLLRRQDKMIFCELHSADVQKLIRHCGRDRRIKVIEIDGYTGLRAYVPPVERRGLVLIDPPFEKTDEFATLARNLVEAWEKWPTGTYCIWYPVKNDTAIELFFDTLNARGIPDILRLELAVRQPEANSGLNSSGLAIINPPYVLADEAQQILPFLQETLAQDSAAGWRIEHITSENI